MHNALVCSYTGSSLWLCFSAPSNHAPSHPRRACPQGAMPGKVWRPVMSAVKANSPLPRLRVASGSGLLMVTLCRVTNACRSINRDDPRSRGKIFLFSAPYAAPEAITSNSNSRLQVALVTISISPDNNKVDDRLTLTTKSTGLLRYENPSRDAHPTPEVRWPCSGSG